MKILSRLQISQGYTSKDIGKFVRKNPSPPLPKNNLPNYDRKVKLIGREYTVREIRSIYKFLKTQVALFKGEK